VEIPLWKLHKYTRLCAVISLIYNSTALDGLGDFNIGGQIIQTVKYADELVLMAKGETVLQGMIDKLIEIGRCYGMEINVEKTKVMRISRQPSPFNKYDRSKTTGECGTF